MGTVLAVWAGPEGVGAGHGLLAGGASNLSLIAAEAALVVIAVLLSVSITCLHTSLSNAYD